MTKKKPKKSEEEEKVGRLGVSVSTLKDGLTIYWEASCSSVVSAEEAKKIQKKAGYDPAEYGFFAYRWTHKFDRYISRWESRQNGKNK